MSKKKSEDQFDTATFEKVSSDSFSTEKGKYKVSLPFLPSMEVDADSAQNAIDLYNKFTGILSTTNRYEVEKIG